MFGLPGFPVVAAVLILAASASSQEPDRPLPDRLVVDPSDLTNYPPDLRPNIEGMRVSSALRATMEFVGQDLGYTIGDGWRTNEAFPFFMGTFGEAFEFRWYHKPGAAVDPERPYSFGNLSGRLRACLGAAGFGCEVLERPQRGEAAGGAFTPEALRKQIVASIAGRSLPVLLLDVPRPDRVLLATGYDQSGAVLIGWGLEGGDDRGIDFAPDKRREFADWAQQATAVVLLTGRGPRKEEGPAYRAALEQAVVLLRERERGHELTGAATFENCARLLADQALNAADPQTAQRRVGILHPLIWDLATRRHYANLFLTRAVKLRPQAGEELQAAAALFRAEHDMMWEIMRLAGGEFPGGDLPKLGDPQVRARIAEVILKARDKDLEAADHIEAALKALHG